VDEYASMRPRSLARLPVLTAVAVVPLALLVLGRAGAAGPQASAWLTAAPSASVSGSASASASAAASSSAGRAVEPPIDEVEAAASRRRERERRERSVEIVDLTPEQQIDPQRFSVGGDAGLGWLTNRGSGVGQPSVNFAISAAFGLGPGGAHEPWSIEAFVAFALTYSTIRGTSGDPNRFTELGARLVYRLPDGPLAHRWVSLGAGLVFSSWGAPGTDPARARGDVTPGALVDLGIGVYEVLMRRARVGIALRVPIQLSAHPGIGTLGVFYAQIGVGK
jgi:hypothetical protein